MKGKLSDFANENDTVLDKIDYPLFRAMGAGVKELEIAADIFPLVMRYATTTNVYHQDGDTPIILGMKIKII